MWLHEQLVANGGSGSPETLGQVITAKAIFDFITNDSISSISVNVGGTGYVVGETFDISVVTSPQVGVNFVARGVVTAIAASPATGVVTQVAIISGGSYVGLANLASPFDTPITGVVTANSSAGGDNALTVDIIPEKAYWTEDRGNGAQSPIASTDYVDDRTNFHWLCTSTKATNPATIGLDSQGGGGNPYVQLVVATGFDKTQSFFLQPGASPNAGNLPCPSNDPEIYVSSTERRVNILIRDGSFSHYGILGFFIPFTNTEANYPFPGLAAGSTTGALTFNQVWATLSSNPSTVAAGIINPMSVQAGTVTSGPYWFRDNLSPQWLSISFSTSELTELRAQMWPAQFNPANYDFTYATQVDGFVTTPNTGLPGFLEGGILREMGSAGSEAWFGSDAGGGDGVQGVGPLGIANRLSFVVQPHIIANQTGDVQIIGIIDGFEAVHGRGLTSFQEIEQFNGKRYIVFPDISATQLYKWVAMEIL